MSKDVIVTKEQEKEYLANLKKDFAITDKDGKINSISDLIGKRLNKRAYIIYWLNMVFFILLCSVVFLFLISPAILWIMGSGPGTETFNDKFKPIAIAGIVFVVATALYGGLVFWVLLVKCAHLNHEGHKIHLYLGVRVVILCVDDRIVSYCKYGWFTVPSASWCAKLDNEQIIKFKLNAKNDYTLDINWYSDSTYERYFEQKYTVNGKDQEVTKRDNFVKEILF